MQERLLQGTTVMTVRNAIAEALDNPTPAPSMAEVGDVPEKAKRERPPFPPGSPIQPLGILADIAGSQRCYYLDVNRQLVALEAGNRHGKNSLIALYGPRSDWLEAHFPQWSQPQYEGRGKDRRLVKASEIIGFDQAEASRAMIEECVRKGPFDPAGRMRGRGAHRTSEGQGLILHCGDKVLVSQMAADGSIKRMRWSDPGLIERNVYSAAEAIPRPWHEAVNAECGETLLALLQTWNWRRPLLDARFVLGAIGAGFIGGALAWRPNIWVTGGHGTGKSSLNGQDGLVHRLFGEGLFRTGDASAAGIRQSLRNATVPVLFDEIEASENNARVAEVIKLARVASSGDKMTRGGQDHTAHEFTLRSSFWFSSVLVPPLEPQDLSRLALLELRPLRRDADPLDLDARNLPALGAKLFRRMVDGWKRLGPTKARFHAALAATGHDSRACDQFGTLLACADVLINDWDTVDGLPEDEEIAHWAQACHPHKLAEVAQAVSEQESCMQHLVTTMVQARGGEEQESLGTWIALGLKANAADIQTQDKAEQAQKRLTQRGLALVNVRWKAGAGGKPGRWGAQKFEAHLPGFLAVSNSHQALKNLFSGTKWQGGVWKQSLSRFDQALAVEAFKMAGVAQRCVLVPLCHVLDESELGDASRAEALAAWIAEQTQGAEG